VFDREPPPDDHPLFAFDNVILTLHSAGLSKEAAVRMAISTARNVLAGIDGTLDPSNGGQPGAVRAGGRRSRTRRAVLLKMKNYCSFPGASRAEPKNP
jgi:hypothetical protein